LEVGVFLIEFLDIQSHVTNDKTICNGTKNQNGNSYNDLNLSSWADFSNTKEIKANIEAYQVAPKLVSIVEVIYLWGTKPDKVHVGNPFFID